MKCTKKARGLTIIGMMIAVAFVGSAIPTASHIFAERRAEARLETIVGNLARIDVAASQWANDHSGAQPSRSNLDGTGGKLPYLSWPTEPAPGAYAISTGAADNAPSTPQAVPQVATYKGGSKEAMTRLQWQQACSANPGGCGL
jgi:hypothetical protein